MIRNIGLKPERFCDFTGSKRFRDDNSHRLEGFVNLSFILAKSNINQHALEWLWRSLNAGVVGNFYASRSENFPALAMNSVQWSLYEQRDNRIVTLQAPLLPTTLRDND